MQMMYVGDELPAFRFLKHVLRSYAQWEEEGFRIGRQMWIGSDGSSEIWQLGMDTNKVSFLRVCELVVFAYSFNGVRESSFLSLY